VKLLTESIKLFLIALIPFSIALLSGALVSIGLFDWPGFQQDWGPMDVAIAGVNLAVLLALYHFRRLLDFFLIFVVECLCLWLVVWAVANEQWFMTLVAAAMFLVILIGRASVNIRLRSEFD
jgi:hypothetical protein